MIFWFSKKPHLDATLEANITEMPLRSAPQTPLGELIALPHEDPLADLRGPRCGGEMKGMRKNGRRKKGRRGDDGRERKGEGRDAWPQPDRIFICHCSDKASVYPRPPTS